MIKKTKVLSVICLVAIGVFLNAQERTTYNVSGYVLLEDEMIPFGTHDGVKIKFYNLPSMVPEDSTTSQSTGYYSINISPGYYLVEWTKTGYVPWELGGFALAENAVLDTVVLIPGEVAEVSGTINTTTWTTSYVYYVTDDITVPAGNTLTINAGVRVKFSSGSGMTVNGTLLANGTTDAHVKFTSREPTPLPGDWTNISLNGHNNVLTYVDYDYATDGFVANDADNTTIDHLIISGTLSLTARGLYFTNSDSLIFTNNFISVAGDYGIYANSASNSNISNNIIITPAYGIRAESCTQCVIDSNTITTGDNTTGPDHAIYTPSSSNINITNNQIVADENGIYTPNSFKAQIKNNQIRGRIYWNGIQFINSDSSTVYKNNVHRTTSNGNDGSWQYLINGEYSEGSIIRKDTLICIDLPDWYRNNMALRCEWSLVDSNYIEFRHSYAENYTIYDNRNSDIIDNEIISSSRSWGTQQNVYSQSSGNYVNRIEGNSIVHDHIDSERFQYAIWTQSNTVVRNNSISCDYLERAIYVQNNCIVDSNSISGDFSNSGLIYIAGDSVTVKDNTIIQSGGGDGIYAQGRNVISVNDNHFTHTGGAKWLVADNSDVTAHHNFVELNSGRGIEIYNQSAGSIYNNTLTSNTGDYGVHISNQTALPVFNNIIQGFQNGIYDENTIQNYNLDHNDLYDISGTLFSGNAIPPLAGQMIDENANGDPSDIYGNINLDPLFVDATNADYSLQGTSPCINAGSENLSDPDGSVSDIGAYYYHIYVVMNHTPLSHTDDTTGPYRINATITSPAGNPLTANLYVSIDGGDFISIPMTEATNDTFYADIPGQPLNTIVGYYIEAGDGTHSETLPFNIENGGYSFLVSLFSQFANMGGSSAVNGDIELTWATPIPISGTLGGLKLYRGTSANVPLTAVYLYQTFTADATAYTDSEVDEAITYYYRLTGLAVSGSDTTEAVVSPEVSVMSDDATIVRVLGTVQLPDMPDHSGVKVIFKKVSPAAVADSLITDMSGEINIVMHVGIYNIHFTKDGYQPTMIGNRFLSANTTLDTMDLVPGGAVELTGDVVDTLYHNNIYFIDGDVTVPSGDTLVIQAGTIIKFRGDYGFTVNGTIYALGTEENPIVFTSGMPSPLEGDWGRVTLNSAPNSILRYCEFYFASDGILVKESHHTEITHCTFDRMLLNSYGITSRNNETGTENDSNNDSLVVSYNVMRDGIQRGIHFRYAQGSRFIGNDLRVTEWGLYCYECDGSEFSDNEIYPDTDGFITGGIHAQNAESSLFVGNTILGIRDYGIYFNSSENSQVLSNVIADTNRQGQTTNDENVYGIYTWDNPSNSQNIIRGNDIYLHHRRYLYGIHANYSLIDSNRIFSWCWEGYNRGIYVNYSDILDNDIVIYTQYDWDSGGRGIEAWANAIDPNLIMRNTIHSIYQSRGIRANYATIKDNIIIGVDDTLGYWPTHTNQQWGITDGPGLNIRNNTITGFRHGISVNGQGTRIINNEVRVWGEYGFDISQGNDAVIQKNTVYMSGGNNHSYGMRLRDGIAADVFCNTIAATGNTGVGMSIENNSHPQIHSNIVYGFNTGINAASAVYVLDFNLVNNNSTALTGDGLPDQAGDIVTVNSNADPSDIYSNIFFDPLFNPPVNDTFQVTLQSGSPAINAGDVDSLDLDGTIADIGSWFNNFGYVPQNVQVDSTGEGFVAFSWEVIETDSITGFQPYYRLSSETDWTPTFVPTIESNIVIDGLTNNSAYDFAVATLYTSNESNLSASVTTKPGIPRIVISPKSLVAIQDVGDTTLVSYTIENTGTKDLEYVIDQNVYYGTRTFTKAAYADWTLPENQDRITDNVWITRQNTQGLFNAAMHSSWNCCTPYGTEWAWGSTEGNSNPYVPWKDVARYGQSGMPVYQSCSNGNVMSLHLIEKDIYFDVTWHLWTQSSGGGFSYTRNHVFGEGQYRTHITGLIPPGESQTLADTLVGSSQGIMFSQIIITSNDPVTPTDTVNVLNITGSQATLPATHFTPVDTTSLVFYYIVESASIDGEALQTGDELALYDGDLCVGAGTYNGVLPFLIQAFGTVGSSAGFTQGETIIVKAWDYGQSRYATIQATTNQGDVIFTAGDFATVNLTGTIYQTIEISLQGNRFNLISSYLYPQYPSISSIFGDLANLKIVYEDNGAAYIPGYGINTIGDLDLTEGYHVFFTGENQDLTFAGLSITPANWPITIQAQRFNSISYLYDSPMDAEFAFSAISDVIEIVQDDDGGAWIPDLGILLGNLEPGSGYHVFTNVDTDVVFTYPEYMPPITARLLASSTDLVPEHFTFRKTGLPYTIVVSSVLVDRRELEEGDEIAVYDGDLCVGATVWTGETPALVTAWRHYPEAQIPGYRPGDPITFRVYKKSYTKEVEVAASFQAPDQQTFEGAVYSVTALNGNPGIIPYQFALKQNYPNPFNPVTTIAYDVAAHSEVTMVVYNLLGQEVIRLLNRHPHQPGKYTLTWKGVNASGESIGSGVYIVRMTTDGFSANRKVILLK